MERPAEKSINSSGSRGVGSSSSNSSGRADLEMGSKARPGTCTLKFRFSRDGKTEEGICGRSTVDNSNKLSIPSKTKFQTSSSRAMAKGILVTYLIRWDGSGGDQTQVERKARRTLTITYLVTLPPVLERTVDDPVSCKRVPSRGQAKFIWDMG